jgi:hypothetical protein
MVKITITHITSLSDIHLSFDVDLCPLGPNDGLILHHPYIIRINNKAMNNPGTVEATNNLPIDVSVIMPYIIRRTLGGIKLPRVLPTAMTPVESFLL